MMDAMRTSIAEQRVYGWFTREAEQAIAHELGIDGAMKADNAETTEVGIFLNDHGVSKMEYYLSTSVAVDCNVEARTVTTSITMTNSVDRDDLTYTIRSLRTPTYGAPQTSMLLDVLYFAPPGATIDGVDPARGDVREPRADEHRRRSQRAERRRPRRPGRDANRLIHEHAPTGRARTALGALLADADLDQRHHRARVRGAHRGRSAIAACGSRLDADRRDRLSSPRFVCAHPSRDDGLGPHMFDSGERMIRRIVMRDTAGHSMPRGPEGDLTARAAARA